MNGILNINKPEGITSHDVVYRIRRLIGKEKVGHTGTLDPMASGVLPLCIGQATRIAQFLNTDIKGYRALVRLGLQTDTQDRTGQVLMQNDCHAINLQQVLDALQDFRGDILQLPPMYSALKKDGKRLYQLARQGITIERTPRPIHIYRLELTDFSPPDFTLEVDCSAGTYIRTLSSDIGQKLGCGATLWELLRTKSGRFNLSESITLEQAQELAAQGQLDSALLSINQALAHLPEAVIKEPAISLIRNGVKIGSDLISDLPLQNEGMLRLLSPDHELIALGYILPSEPISLQPKLVFSFDSFQ